MAVITHGGTLPDGSQKTDFYALIDNATTSGIVNADCSNSMALVDSKLAQITTASKVHGSSLTALGSVPSGSTALPVTSGGTGSTSAANAASGVVVLDSSARLPAVSAALLTNLPYWPYVKVSDTKSSTTVGGSATTGSWQDRVLNTTDNDTGSISSLGSNHVTLPAGTYIVKARSPFTKTGNTQIRLYNITDSAVIIVGCSGHADGAVTEQSYSFIEGIFTIAASKALAIQYQVAATNSTSDLGSPCSFTSTAEVYTVAEFTKIA